MSFKKDLSRITHPYYLVNIFLSLSYLLAKKFPYVCNYLFFNSESKCELDSRESEILLFLIIVVMIRSRKTGSVTMISYLSSSFIYTKVANMILWFCADFRMGLVYCVLFVLTGIFFPEPTYSGPSNVTYFRGLQGLEDEMERDKRVNWVVAFYTMWSPSCNNFAPIFAQLSASNPKEGEHIEKLNSNIKNNSPWGPVQICYILSSPGPRVNHYHTDTLKFGKVDIGRYPEAGKKYHISDSPVSRQLPTLILFQNGKEVIRRPTVDRTGKLQKFFFSEDNIRVTFDLNNLYEQNKGKLKIEKKVALHGKKDQ